MLYPLSINNQQAHPDVFGCRYGGLEDFDKGVRELVGAPHPQVWDEINKEHRQRGDSDRHFSPGNYGTPPTTPKEEFMIVIDPKSGKAVSTGMRLELFVCLQFG